MRLSTDEDRNKERALRTIAAAVEAGITVFDTAHAYALGESELGHNERLLARALRGSGADASARVVTKGGMTRAGGGWIPDGRAKAIRADCEASLEALDGLPIDLYLIHAPDPRTPWRTSVRALGRLEDEGAVRRVGLANVNRRQLDEALELAPVAAVQVALSPYDDTALRGGVVERCVEKGIAVIAHSPLGGPRRAGRLARLQILASVAEAHGATAAEVALAWLLELAPVVIPIPGARHPGTARSAVRAATLELEADDRAVLDETFGAPGAARSPRRHAAQAADVVVVMGVPGAGKSRVAEQYAARGYLRLNRDQRGGTLRELAGSLDQELGSGTRRVVLDNTYLTRATRSHVIETANRHRTAVRCIWLDTPLAQAQINAVERMLERLGALPTPDELRTRAREPGVLAPTSQMRAFRELEPPSADEGWTTVEHVPFTREPSSRTRPGVFVAAAALRQPDWERVLDGVDPEAPCLVFDWSADGSPGDLAELTERLDSTSPGRVESALCPHGGGPPRCWCRPPLPGLPLAFARAHDVDPARSMVVGLSPAHRALATALDARFVPA